MASLECTRLVFGPMDPLAGLWGPTSNGREEKGQGRGGRRKGRGKEGKVRGKKESRNTAPSIPAYTPD